jgi:hypothetical protein
MARPDDETERRRLPQHGPGRGDPRHRGTANPGFRATGPVRRDRENDAEFMTLTWSGILGSVREFTGQDYQAAHVPPQAQAVPAAFDHLPAHYQVPGHRKQPR